MKDFSRRQQCSLLVFVCVLSLCTASTNNSISDIKTITSQIHPYFNQKQIDTKKLQQINQYINEHFQNCQIQQSSTLLYDCEIVKQDYPQFLYAFFSQQLFNQFLTHHQQKHRKMIKNNLQEMKKFKQHVRDMLINAYWDFVDVYKPNKKVTVGEAYIDMYTHDFNMLDFVQHYNDKYQEFINVLKHRVGKQANNLRKYLSVKGKTPQQSKQLQAKIFARYFGNCTNQQECQISIKAYPFYLKDLFFYSNPQIGRVQRDGYVYVRSEIDFQVTEYFVIQAQRLQPTLGQIVKYKDRNTHFRQLVEKLKQLLGTKRLKKYIQKRYEQREFIEQL